jgi:hypothetical protein
MLALGVFQLTPPSICSTLRRKAVDAGLWHVVPMPRSMGPTAQPSCHLASDEHIFCTLWLPLQAFALPPFERIQDVAYLFELQYWQSIAVYSHVVGANFNSRPWPLPLVLTSMGISIPYHRALYRQLSLPCFRLIPLHLHLNLLAGFPASRGIFAHKLLV